MSSTKPLRVRLSLLLIKILAGFFAITFLWVLSLRWMPVLVTPLMVKRSIEYRQDKDFSTTLKWRPIRKISPEMVKAVIASEDNMFDLHDGFDWIAIGNAIQTNRQGKRLLGGSTISQQTAKNVFCLPSRTWVRKGFEGYFTVLIEALWSKERIMEVYLNVAEMGPGIYGIEAASRHYFSKSATDLTQREACLVAACLPNPLKRDPSKPTAYLNGRVKALSSLERKIAYPSWVTRAELTEEQLAKEMAKREEKRLEFRQKQRAARRKILHPSKSE